MDRKKDGIKMQSAYLYRVFVSTFYIGNLVIIEASLVVLQSRRYLPIGGLSRTTKSGRSIWHGGQACRQTIFSFTKMSQMNFLFCDIAVYYDQLTTDLFLFSMQFSILCVSQPRFFGSRGNGFYLQVM